MMVDRETSVTCPRLGLLSKLVAAIDELQIEELYASSMAALVLRVAKIHLRQKGR